MQEKDVNIKQLALGMAAYTSASILGPLILFGGLGMYLDNKFQKDTFYTLICIVIAFIFTNILLFKKVKKLNAMMAEYGKEVKKKKIEEGQEKTNKEEK